MGHGREGSNARRRFAALGALASVLIVCGVLALSGIVAPPPPPAVLSTAAEGATPAVATIDAGDSSAVERHPVPAMETVAVVPVLAEPCTIRVAVQRFLGDRRSHYTGPLRVLAGAHTLLQTTLVNSQPVSLDLPAGLATLRFEAEAHEPAELAVAEVAARRDRRGTIELQPQTVVELQIVGLPELASASVEWRATTEHQHFMSAIRDGAAFSSGPVVVPFVPDAAFTWNAKLLLGDRCIRLQGDERALLACERRTVVLDVTTVRTQRYRVVGPSAELMPHVKLSRSWQQGDEQVFDKVVIDAEGTCDVVTIPGAEWRAGRTTLQGQQRGDEIWLRPQQPLVGIGLRNDAGEVRASGGQDGAGRPLGPAEVHVMPRLLAAGARLIDGNKHWPVRDEDLASGHDLVWLRESAAPIEPGRLVVRIVGVAPAAAKMLRIGVRTKNGTQSEPAASEVEFTIPDGEACDIAWQVPGGRPVDITRGRQVPIGQTVTVEAEWPACEVWQGEVAGRADLPLERRWGKVGWGDGWPFGKGWQVLSDKDHFEVCVLAGEALPTHWRLWWGTQAVPARIEGIDAGQRRFVVRALSTVRWVPVRVHCAARWSLLVGGHRAGDWPLSFSARDNESPLPVAQGQSVHGAVMTGWMGQAQRTIAWWSVVDGIDELQIVPANGRTIELRPAAARSNRGVALVGPHGQRDQGYGLETDAPLRVWVPDGTRGLAVFDGNDVQGTLREIPLGSGDVVVID